MSRKFRRFYETAFDSKISKSDEDLLSAEKQDSAIARRLSNQLQLSASASSVVQRYDDDGDTTATSAVRDSPSSRIQYKNRLFGFLLGKKRKTCGGGGRQLNSVYKYNRSSDSVVTSSSLSLESITSDSLSSHSSESPGYNCKRFPVVPHVLSPISDKSSQDAGVEFVDYERRKSSAAATVDVKSNAVAAAVPRVKTCKPPQSLGLIKLNGDHQQHHGSDSGISVGSKPGDNYQELLDVPFDMPKLRRRQRSEDGPSSSPPSSLSWDCTALRPVTAAAAVPLPSLPPLPKPPQPQALPFDMPKLRRRQQQTNADGGAALPFDMPKLRKRQMDSCAMVISLDFEIGNHAGPPYSSDRLVQLPTFDAPKLKNIDLHDEGEKKPDRNSLFLNVIPNNCAAVNPNNKLLSKTFQIKSKCAHIIRNIIHCRDSTQDQTAQSLTQKTNTGH